MLAVPCLCARMPFPDHAVFVFCKDLPHLRSLAMEWGSSEPVIFGDVLRGLTQLKTLDLTLLHFSGLQQLPPHVTLLRLHSWKLLDIAMVPCLQSCSGLQSLELVGAQGLCRYAVTRQHCFSAQAVPVKWVHGLQGL